ncbi:MAG: hypothetical protein JO150_04660 [Acidobacteriaceae bacterium]|nr:hypothetical protein [Acidobacteriaceae bacterium]
MQRGIASLLTVLFGWLLILPAVASRDNTALPACCRTNGKHHCLLPMKEDGSSSNTTRVLASKCPLFLQATGAVHVSTDQPSFSGVGFAGLASYPAVSPQMEVRRCLSLSRSCQQRGPPHLS